MKHRLIKIISIILVTFLLCPDGKCFFNPMAPCATNMDSIRPLSMSETDDAGSSGKA